MENPLLVPFIEAPFSKIKNEHYIPAFTTLIESTNKEIEEIVNNTAAPTFKNTIEALEHTGEQLNRVSSIFFNLNSAETSPELQKIAQEVSPLLTKFKNDLLLNEALFKKVKTVHTSIDKITLTPEERMMFDKQYKGFTRNGALLNSADKETLRKIDTELAKLQLTFGENVLADSQAFELHITNESDLKGLPEGVKEAAFQTAKERSKTGWVFTLDYPSYIPFVTYAENRALRKEITLAFGARGFQQNKNNNEKILLTIARLRNERALLLGYSSYAHFVLEERMAKTPETVLEFLTNLKTKAKPAALKEFKKLQDFAFEQDGIATLEKWDSAYYSEKLKQKLFHLDDEMLKPFFNLNTVIEGMFSITQSLYNLTFKQNKTAPVYHPDVLVYDVFDENNSPIALLYADFHPRAGKRAGAWMTSYKPQQISNGENQRPHISIVCNFTKPTPTKPALLTFNEVTTLFHEFGHALHGMLANTTYSSLSGTNVMWDFVELPSQIFENWCYEKEALERFALHYETNEAIPMEYIDKIKAAATFNEGMQTLRQLSFGFLDMAWHSQEPPINTIVKEFEKEAFKDTQLYPSVPTTCMSTAFSHIFQGGYAAGYYSYKWAEVLDADAFSLFKEKGIFNTSIAQKFKDTVLSKGGTIDPMELYILFRGKKPNADALLKRAGLID